MILISILLWTVLFINFSVGPSWFVLHVFCLPFLLNAVWYMMWWWRNLIGKVSSFLAPAGMPETWPHLWIPLFLPCMPWRGCPVHSCSFPGGWCFVGLLSALFLGFLPHGNVTFVPPAWAKYTLELLLTYGTFPHRAETGPGDQLAEESQVFRTLLILAT